MGDCKDCGRPCCGKRKRTGAEWKKRWENLTEKPVQGIDTLEGGGLVSGKGEDSHVPPAGVREEAKRALEWLKDGEAGSGFTDVGRRRASDLARGRPVSMETLKRMKAYFDRHQGDKRGEGWSPGEPGYPSPGRVAWAAWGGDAGWSWARGLVGRDEKAAKPKLPPGFDFYARDGDLDGLVQDGTPAQRRSRTLTHRALGRRRTGKPKRVRLRDLPFPYAPDELPVEPPDRPVVTERELSGEKSLARTPAPSKDRVFGSDRNRRGSASGSGSVEFDDATEAALRKKVESHNAAMREADKPAWSMTSLRALKAVYRRGAGAFSTSHRPGMTRNQWAMGRVNAFLKMLRSGRPDSAAYTTDNDLLHADHPWRSKK